MTANEIRAIRLAPYGGQSIEDVYPQLVITSVFSKVIDFRPPKKGDYYLYPQVGRRFRGEDIPPNSIDLADRDWGESSPRIIMEVTAADYKWFCREQGPPYCSTSEMI